MRRPQQINGAVDDHLEVDDAGQLILVLFIANENFELRYGAELVVAFQALGHRRA